MRFLSVTLSAPADRVDEVHAFYAETLGLGAGIGETALDVAPAEGSPFHHLALLVPGDRLDAAHAWAGTRVALLAGPEGTDVFGFERWRARACYFHDPGGSILELIAHTAIAPSGRRGAFEPQEIVGVSELGLVGDAAGLAAGLAELGLPLWDGSPAPGEIAFVGEPGRSFVLVNPGRGWLPTGRPAEAHPVAVVVAAPRAGELEAGPVRIVARHSDDTGAAQ